MHGRDVPREMMKAAVLIAIVLAAVAAADLSGARSVAQNRDTFRHSTAAHKRLDCSSCHKMPTANWSSARGFPDVADFPGHASCINCHRRDFFVGNKPAFCAGCHVNPGPRGAARFPFPVQSRSHEFQTIFPHNVHQDIIAGVPGRRDEVAVAHFVNASYSTGRLSGYDDKSKFNNCAICHQTSDKIGKMIARTPAGQQPLAAAAPDAFAAKASYFKDMPEGHASCFACHYQGAKPVASNCAGCHSLTSPYAASSTVRRYSFKFDHNQKDHANADCMSCHVRIASNSDVRKLTNADVPFISCYSCHTDKISEELAKRADSVKNNAAAFQCSYCHTTEVGRFPVPPSHEVP